MDNNIINSNNLEAMKGVRVILCPTLDLAKEEAKKHIDYSTVEAEYGSAVVEGSPSMGSWATLAHHSIRSNNPAPCIWNKTGNGNTSPKLPEAILISHIDLDTLGGIGLLLGYYNEAEQPFWEGAAYIDVHGPHHINTLPNETKSQLRAYWAYNERNRAPRFTRDAVTDVTELVCNTFTILDRIVNNDPELIADGERWDREVTAAVESCLVYQSGTIRAFCGGLFTASSYLGSDGNIRVATISFNTKTRAITLAFEDGGKRYHAAEIMQHLFGPEAGGREGIAGTPRGKEFTVLDLARTIEYVERLLNKE